LSSNLCGVPDNRSTIWPIVNEIQGLIGKCISFQLFHVKRGGNVVAHTFAKFASVLNSEQTLMHEIFLPCIKHDCNAVVKKGSFSLRQTGPTHAIYASVGVSVSFLFMGTGEDAWLVQFATCLEIFTVPEKN
jgi:hypothetical protein